MDTGEKARLFIYRNARPLDFARWQFHFEGGSREAVLEALAAYQNGDGGFGHALEADAWNPNSTPIQTWTATEILREIRFTDETHPIIEGILGYLGSGQDFDGKSWLNTVHSNNDYPHAPWWETGSESTSHHSYNPGACLAGFLIRFADQGTEQRRIGERVAREAVDEYLNGGLLEDMHTAACYIRLVEYCEEAGEREIFDPEALSARLREQVRNSITQDKAAWESGYICKPSQFFMSRDSIFHAENREIAAYECDFIRRTQLEDGSWSIPWGWADYPEQWALSKNWWKSNNIIQNMRFLEGMGRLKQG